MATRRKTLNDCQVIGQDEGENMIANIQLRGLNLTEVLRSTQKATDIVAKTRVPKEIR